MAYNPAEAQTLQAPRSNFPMNSRHLTAIDFDYLYPLYWDEILAGDTVNMNARLFGRFATLANPILDNCYLDIHWFYAPQRILWTNARKFYGEQVDPGDSIDYTVPVMAAPASTGYSSDSLQDYFGLPPEIPDFTHISLPFRMYNFVWNEFFRDQNLQDSIVVDVDDGPDNYTDYVLKKRNKKHDYFTSGLPNILKDPATAQTLPLGTSAPVLGIGKSNQTYAAGGATMYESGGSSTTYSFQQGTDSGTNPFYIEGTAASSAYPNIRADLSNATAATILQLRQAVQIQAILELDARAGTRYPEQLYAVYGVRFDDVSYRPEFLGSQTARINIQSVAQTSNDGTNGDVGDLSAIGTVSINGGGFTKSFNEPGYILGLVSARADIGYQQGLDRKWSRTDRYSYFHPYLQGIGDQATLKKEIVLCDPAQDTGSTGTKDNERTFNYAERYAEYKFKNSHVTGLFRSTHASTLHAWHLVEELTDKTEPNFNAAFIAANTPVDRVIEVTTQPHLILDCDFQCNMARPMHAYSIPGMGTRL
jgi:hypothetical protein